jgi:alpha-beta hydrolase superfamily lysophospholipase
MKIIKDAGLANEYWKKYYSTEEVDLIQNVMTTTQFVSGNLPIHVRQYLQEDKAPTVVMCHGLLTYGGTLGHTHLHFYRAGFNVINWDAPGFGQSGGARGGPTIPQMVSTWKDAISFAHQRFGDPLYIFGWAEDAVSAYYAAANDARVRAMTLHLMCELGDLDNLHWVGSHLRLRIQVPALALLVKLWPSFTIPARKAFPWETVFSGVGDEKYMKIFAEDPLTHRFYDPRLAISMVKKNPPDVRFEENRTPIRLITSDKDRLWPHAMNMRCYQRLGGEKDLVILKGKNRLEHNRPWQEMLAEHGVGWFKDHGAEVVRRTENTVGATT